MTGGKEHESPANRLDVTPRRSCAVCRRPASTCYCPALKPFESLPRFVILTHPREAKHRLSTGRMAQLCMTNSLLVEGTNFSDDERIEAILRDPSYFAVLLYPEKSAIDLSLLSQEQRTAIVPAGKELVVFVPDGTWTTARKMVRASENLKQLPSISFTPPTTSAYHIRRQPRLNIYCTIEAIHHVIDLFSESAGPTIGAPRPHDNLLEVFQLAVKRQLSYTPRDPR